MLTHPQFDTVAIHLGPLAIRWYGLMYLVAFSGFYLLGRYRLKQSAWAKRTGMTPRHLEDLLFYGALGVVLGGRLGYVLFYKPAYYLSHLSEIPAVWQGGMSFHGGFLGVCLAVILFCRNKGLKLASVADFVAPLAPLGLAAGRLANFINGELWGRATNVPWAMVFPQAGDQVPRHPSQLYQFAGEGLVLLALLWWYSSRPRKEWAVTGMFLLGYGVLRSLAEFAREPDSFLGVFLGGVTMGQILSIPMVLLGAWLIWRKPSL
jgi:phosphatidylglycerol---prolipoprotein diacylglyceryl transferase